MTNTEFFSAFTNQYQLSKTLRFELKPVGETLDNIEKKGLLDQDQQRADSYQKMKKTIDEYHKYFIEIALKNVQLKKLNEYLDLYNQTKELRDDEAFKKVKTDLRKEIVTQFKTGNGKQLFENLFSADLIKKDLHAWVYKQKGEDLFPNEELGGINAQKFLEGKEKLYFDAKFENFTTYFTGFHENRQNMYSAEEHGTAIAYRIIHENLPKYIENINIYEAIKEKHPVLLANFLPILTEMEEIIQGYTLDEIFCLDYFNNLLTQNGIDFINAVIGGKSIDNNIKKIRGLNEYINLYNQLQTDKKNRVPKFKQLYKQILSDRNTISFLPESFKNDSHLLSSIETFYQTINGNFEFEDKKHLNVLDELKELVSMVPTYNLDKIFLRNDTNITTISQRIFGDFGVIAAAVNDYYDTHEYKEYGIKHTNAKTKKQREDLEKKKNKFIKQPYLSIAFIQNCLNLYIIKIYEPTHEIRIANKPNVLASYFQLHFKARNIDENETNLDIISNIKQQYLGVKGLLNIEKTDTKTLAQDKDKVHQLKTFLDSIMEFNHFIKSLNITTDTVIEKDDLFYDQFTPLFQQLNLLIPLYNMVRNYLTQKPYSIEKIKLNFENAELLNGWDENKESAYLNVLLRKDGLYYLAIMDKKFNKIFENAPIVKDNEPCFEKMTYKLLPGANKMLPKVFFSKSNIGYFNPSVHIQNIRNTASHSKNGEPQNGFEKADFNLGDCRTLIDFFKASLEKHEDWKNFNFSFSSTNEYQDMSGFYREVEQQGYKIIFENISEEYINQKVKDGKLYLFQIYNKDFSPYSKGKPNMHTMYWKSLFELQNLADVVYKLNGQAEVFYRKSSILEKNIISHKANEPIRAKNPLTPSGINKFEYDIVKDRRFTIDKFQFHIPITLNFKATGGDIINNQTNEFLRNNPDVKIIGLDRGERHLIYLTLIDQQGNILIQESLNDIKDEKHNIVTPYQTLLDDKEKGRAEARVSWGTIETIKELKEGYISQVVHKIATMMVQHNAIVIMEDLNFGFKRGRFKVEKQVYQKLEKMLIDKLNYLVFKDAEPNAPGGLLNALQLTNKFVSFQKMGKQSGFLFYVPAWNTSKIDPTTGFVDFLKPKYESIIQSKDFFEKFDFIKFNKVKDYFEFSFDYKNFTTKAEETQTKWIVCTHGDTRYTYNSKDKTTQKINITKELKELFTDEKIDYVNEDNLTKSIIKSDNKAFFVKLNKYLSIVLSLRYSSAADSRDFILSPVSPNNKGVFFNSETADVTLPKDADANGAYHIALKGLWVLQQLRQFNKDKKMNLAISNKDWLKFVQEKNYKL